MTDSLLTIPDLTNARKTLRRDMRRRRRAVTRADSSQAGRRLLHRFRHAPGFLSARRVAVYLPNDGEIPTQWLIRDLQSRGREVYLPVLHPLRRGCLSFIRYTDTTPMTRNRFGISEPDFRYGQRVSARFLSLICLPLVAFDGEGNRLGMGGGFYDRTLAFMQGAGLSTPRLTGVAYAFQRVGSLPVESWDIPLQMIVTDSEVIG